jgi:hypothetical protein
MNAWTVPNVMNAWTVPNVMNAWTVPTKTITAIWAEAAISNSPEYELFGQLFKHVW